MFLKDHSTYRSSPNKHTRTHTKEKTKRQKAHKKSDQRQKREGRGFDSKDQRST